MKKLNKNEVFASLLTTSQRHSVRPIQCRQILPSTKRCATIWCTAKAAVSPVSRRNAPNFTKWTGRPSTLVIEWREWKSDHIYHGFIAPFFFWLSLLETQTFTSKVTISLVVGSRSLNEKWVFHQTKWVVSDSQFWLLEGPLDWICQRREVEADDFQPPPWWPALFQNWWIWQWRLRRARNYPSPERPPQKGKVLKAFKDLPERQ